MGEKATFEKLLEDGRIIFTKNGAGLPRKKQFQSERQAEGQAASNWFNHDQFGSNQEGSAELEELFDGVKSIFDNPKPTRLVENLVLLGNLRDNDIVLDFFAGSATTAHAVFNANIRDGIQRRVVAIQLPEPNPRHSVANKAGYATIADISRERIRLAGAKVSEDYSAAFESRENALDIGFRSYKLADTNFAKWRSNSDLDATQLEQHLMDLRESADDDATPDDLFTEILIKQGHSLVEQIRDRNIGGLSYKAVVRVDNEDGDEDTLVLAYLDEHTKPTLAQLREAMEIKPAQFIMLEDAFQGDDELKTNLAQICKTNGIELWTA
ncbi:DNA methyltransferase [Corynebacterium macginleyi]|uniref:DNA methyltransferase n=1 Tax=Corynebacterium macginleyi TaxID=38290 RepID=UPI000EF9DD8E|nr:DNA methyltransferase [Corynebacterium macginleyi]QRP22290.1 hypothetical protein I6J25_05840 [Corynebacterium macginleyi]RMB68181.1 hypothetical protein D9V82_02070 [Corynebacterium macginleyi]